MNEIDYRIMGDHLSLLLETVQKQLPDEPIRVLQHGHTVQTEKKQMLLPNGVAVQKSLTVAYGEGLLVLVSGIGNFRLSRRDLRVFASTLGIPAAAARQSTINPVAYPSETVSGLPYGMVSPFMPPALSLQRSPSFSAVILLEQGEEASLPDTVAVSLSLSSSLLLPTRSLVCILKAYAMRAYPMIPLFVLPGSTGSQPERAETWDSPVERAEYSTCVVG